MTNIQEDKLDIILRKIYQLEMRFALLEDKMREINLEGCWLRHQDKQEYNDPEN